MSRPFFYLSPYLFFVCLPRARFGPGLSVGLRHELDAYVTFVLRLPLKR